MRTERRGAVRRSGGWLFVPAALWFAACGASSPPAEGPPPVPAAQQGSTEAPAPLPVPVRYGRTLLTQPAEESAWVTGTSPGSVVPDERVINDAAVPMPRGGVDAPMDAPEPEGLERDEIASVIRAQQSRFRHCFDRLRQANPSASEARIEIRFTIAASGSVEDAEVASATTRDAAFADCMRMLVRALDFPAAGRSTEVTYPFAFQSTVGSE